MNDVRDVMVEVVWTEKVNIGLGGGREANNRITSVQFGDCLIWARLSSSFVCK